MSTTDPTSATSLPGLLKKPVSPEDARLGDLPERRLAWAREMERAQLDSWFKPMLDASNKGAGRVANGLPNAAQPARSAPTPVVSSQERRQPTQTAQEASLQSSARAARPSRPSSPALASQEALPRLRSERRSLDQDLGMSQSVAPLAFSPGSDPEEGQVTTTFGPTSASTALSLQEPSVPEGSFDTQRDALFARDSSIGSEGTGPSTRSAMRVDIGLAMDAQGPAAMQLLPASDAAGVKPAAAGPAGLSQKALAAQVESFLSAAPTSDLTPVGSDGAEASRSAAEGDFLAKLPVDGAPTRTPTSAHVRGVDVHSLSRSSSQSPVRLHEEKTPKGQAVWIAMRADDATLVAMLPQWIDDLQRAMRARGERLHQVVCNGQIVWRDGALTQPQAEGRPGAASYSSMFDSIKSKEA